MDTAALSCSPGVYRLGGVGLGPGTMGKLGCAWVGACHGAWVVVVVVLVVMWMM